VVSTGHFFRRNWSNYIDLHNARKENQELQEEIARLKLEQIRYRQDAEQAQRLQALLGFKQNYVGQIMAAQVIGTSGMEQSRMITIDKGSHSGVKIDMAVITPDGIVGKVKDVSPLSAQVLLVNDRDSGAGVILQGSRLQGILRGTPQGELRVADVMADESIQVGEQVITSGGDRIYPKGVPVGTVSSVAPDHDNDPFLAIKVKPAADLARLEEVLVVMTRADELPNLAGTTQRAADLLAQRLPGVNKVDPASKEAAAKAGVAKPGASPSTGTAVPLSAKPSTTPVPAANNKPAPNTNQPAAAVSPSPTPVKRPTVKTNGAPTSPEVPAGTVASGASTAVPGATPKPKPVVKKPKPQATPTPAGTDQPESKPPDNQPDNQKQAPAAEKPPR
jgi:rod shape-determining protein MreC